MAQDDKLTRFLALSTVMHVMLFVVVVFFPKFLKHEPERWGSSKSVGARVGVTDMLPGIPLPSPPQVQENAKGNDSDSLNPADVAPKPVEKVPSAAEIKIPSTTKPEPKNTGPTKAVRGKPEPETTPPPMNAIPGQASGQVALPYGSVGGSGSQATFGDESFGTRFPEYVGNLTRALHEKWQRPANVPKGTKVYLMFTIPKKGGEAQDVKIDNASGSSLMDNSAKRAVLTANIPPLPREYSGSSIEVRFYFEYSR